MCLSLKLKDFATKGSCQRGHLLRRHCKGKLENNECERQQKVDNIGL